MPVTVIAYNRLRCLPNNWKVNVSNYISVRCWHDFLAFNVIHLQLCMCVTEWRRQEEDCYSRVAKNTTYGCTMTSLLADLMCWISIMALQTHLSAWHKHIVQATFFYYYQNPLFSERVINVWDALPADVVDFSSVKKFWCSLLNVSSFTKCY